jgi:KaiC/GvpD/RAD55 family RecA-like ATPase
VNDQTVEAYKLDPKFERACVALACSDRAFFKQVGYAIDPDALGADEAKLLMQAVRVIDEEGAPPSSALVVIQRLARWRVEGRVTQEEIRDCDDYLAEAEDLGLPPVGEVADTLSPVLKRSEEKKAVRLAMDLYTKKGDMQDVVRHLQATSRIGNSAIQYGTKLGSVESLAKIEAIRGLKRLPTGVPELDHELKGGPARKTLTVFMGSSGAGKSMMLNHMTATATLSGLFVLYATLELPEPYVHGRLLSNILGIPTDEIVDGICPESLLEERLDELRARGTFGACVVGEFTPHATMVSEIVAWVAEEEEKEGRKVDLLAVDYADKLAYEEKGEYTGMREVYEGLRVFGVAHDIWVATASQSKRRGERKNKRQDIDDVGDSIHKVRVADLWITLNAQDDAIEYLVSKNRLGKGRAIVGPIPHEFEYARMCPVYDDGFEDDADGWDPPV